MRESRPDECVDRTRVRRSVREHRLRGRSSRDREARRAAAEQQHREHRAEGQAIVEPRARANRTLLRRAIDRGEIPADIDVEMLAVLTPSMVTYRVLLMREPVDRDYLISLVDNVPRPAVGLRGGVPAP
nr:MULTISPECIES: TetR-like C-terminal domain-containing protein [unclassified Rathayibacter]